MNYLCKHEHNEVESNLHIASLNVMLMNKRIAVSGFTLVELMVVIAITAIMASIALPNMSHWIASQRLQNRADQLVTLFQFSRSEAIRLNKPVIVCPTTIRAQTGNPNACNNFKDYNDTTPIQGLVAWKDDAINNTFVSDNAIRTVAINQNDNANDSKVASVIRIFNNNGNENTDAKRDITRIGFMPNGMLGWTSDINGGMDNWSQGTSYISITLSDRNQQNLIRNMVIDPSGRAFVCTDKQENKICKKLP